MTREEMWKEFENQLIRETRTPITVSYDVSERMIKSAIEETVAKWKERLEHEPCDDAISREEVTQSRPEWLSEDVERDTDEQTVVDRAFSRGWNSCLKEFLKNIKELPSITPQPFINKPCVSEGVCREDKIQVLDKIRAEIDSYCSDNRDKNDGLYIAMRIIDKYRESEV